MVPGLGTLVNVVTVLVGAGLGRLLGDRLPTRTRDLVTDALGLDTLRIAGTSAVAVADPALAARVGDSAPMLIVLGAVVGGGVFLGLIFSLAYMAETTEHRVIKAGYRPGTAVHLREQAGMAAQRRESERKRAAAAKRADRYRRRAGG